MGLLKGSFTCRRYLVLAADVEASRDRYLQRLQEQAFQEPLSAAKKGEVSGWVSAHNLTDTEFTLEKCMYSQYFAFALRTDVKKLPARLFNALLDNEYRKWMQQSGRERVPAAVKKELRDRLELHLLPRQLPTVSSIEVMWDITRNEVLFFSLSEKTNDRFRKLFSRTFQVHLRPLGPVRLGLQLAPDRDERLRAFDGAGTSMLFPAGDALLASPEEDA